MTIETKPVTVAGKPAPKTKQKEQRPEPMNLMHKREKMIDELFPLPYRKPEVTLGAIDKAARAMADWDLSDPFAYGRAALHVRQGYIDPKTTVKEYEERTIARRAARRREAEKEKHSE